MVDIEDYRYTLPANSRLHHIYNTNYPTGSFNASGLGDKRFDPITNSENKIIPTLYAAEHYIDAIAETLMRKNNHNKRLFTGNVSQCGLLQFDIDTKLTLVDISRIPALDDLTAEGNQAYSQLQVFSKWLAVNHQEIHGITWYGYQREIKGHRCMMFFGDRVSPENLRHRVNEPLTSPTAIQKLRDASLALHCDLPTDFQF